MTLNKVLILVLVTRITDALSTYFSSPDLTDEVNQVVVYSYQLYGWIGVIILGIIYTSIVMLAYVWAFKKEQLFNIDTISFKAYYYKYFYGRILSFNKSLFTKPKIQNILVFTGQFYAIYLITYSILISISNIYLGLVVRVDFLYDQYVPISNAYTIGVYNLHLIILLPTVFYFLYAKHIKYQHTK